MEICPICKSENITWYIEPVYGANDCSKTPYTLCNVTKLPEYESDVIPYDEAPFEEKKHVDIVVCRDCEHYEVEHSYLPKH